MIGGMNRSKSGPAINYTDEQWETLGTLLDELKDQFPAAKVSGHCAFAKKTCPNIDEEFWYDTGEVVSTI